MFSTEADFLLPPVLSIRALLKVPAAIAWKQQPMKVTGVTAQIAPRAPHSVCGRDVLVAQKSRTTRGLPRAQASSLRTCAYIRII